MFTKAIHFFSPPWLWAFLLCLSANACHSDYHPQARLAVYRWKTSPRILPSERLWLDSLRIQRLYLRFFDLDVNNPSSFPEPVAPLKLPLQNLPDSLDIVPVVFITNRSLQNLPKGDAEKAIKDLEKKLYAKIKSMSARLPKGTKITEWQLDCDWTAETRDAYFELLQALAQRLEKDGIGLSATIRLHQVKYPELTGVPPVARGMLMYYNMSDVRQAHTRNSILDPKVAARYHTGLGSYPLPLDIALPIFHWIVVRREGKVVQLLSGLGEEALQDDGKFEQLSQYPPLYRVKRSTYLKAYYLYAGDSLRVEITEPDSLEKARAALWAHLPAEERYLALYHLDSSSINRFDHEKIREIFFGQVAE